MRTEVPLFVSSAAHRIVFKLHLLIRRKRGMQDTLVSARVPDVFAKGARMFTSGVRWLSVIACLVCGAAPALASPITYSISGTLNQPYNGSTQFSGTVTYDTDLPLNPQVTAYTGWSYYLGTPPVSSEPPASLMLNLGGTSSTSLGPVSNVEVIVSHTQDNDSFNLFEQFSPANGLPAWANFGISNNNLTNPAPFTSTDLPAGLSLSAFSNGAQLTFGVMNNSGSQQVFTGTITSMAAAPEPASVLIFGILGAGLWASRRASIGRRGARAVR
jgi:hypothetical protein